MYDIKIMFMYNKTFMFINTNVCSYIKYNNNNMSLYNKTCLLMWMIAVFETLCNWWIWTFGHGAGLLVPPFIVPHCVDILSVVSLCGPQTVSFPACSSVCAAATFLQRCVNQVSSQAWLSAAGMWLSLYLLSRLCPQSLHSHHQSSISPPSSLYMLSRLCSVWTYATLHHPPSSIHPPPSSIFTPGPTNIH